MLHIEDFIDNRRRR